MIVPQKKIIEQAGKFGQKNLVKQQGTSRMIWDTLLLVPGQFYYRFFEGVNTRTFPLTNLTDNKLEAGESLACQFMMLTIIQKLKGATGVWHDALPITWPMAYGEINMELSNTIVMKPISLLPFRTEFSRMPNADGNVFKLYTNQVIMPLVPFNFQARFPQIPTDDQYDLYIRLTVKGTGSILSPKATL